MSNRGAYNKDRLLEGKKMLAHYVGLTLGFLLWLALLGTGPAIAADRSCMGTPPSPVPGFCTATSGDSNLLIEGEILTPHGILSDGQLLIDTDGTIRCAACDCSSEAGHATATRLVCPGVAVSPGLIDAYRTINFETQASVDHGAERFEHRHDWRRGLNGHTELGINSDSSAADLGEFRAIVAGVTSLVGSGSIEGLARNLAASGDPLSAWDLDVFPLGDANGSSLTDSCDYGSFPTADPTRRSTLVIAEGIDDRARNEFLCLADTFGSRGGVNAIEQAAVRGGIGLTTADIVAMALADASLIWTPRSNLSLYGLSAPAALLHRLGGRVLLGSRWGVTGSFNLLEELACAAEYTDTFLQGLFGPKQLFDMVTQNAALGANLPNIGALRAGALADVALFDPGSRTGYEAVTGATDEDVLLVLREGIPLYGERALMEALGAQAPDCEALQLCGRAKRLCAQRETGQSLPVGYVGELATCGAAPQRNCVPERVIGRDPLFSGSAVAGDEDGDGIADGNDNCPSTFNPPLATKPVAQQDFDGDGIGDACDATPVPDQLFHAFRSGFEGNLSIGGTVSGLGRSGLILQLNDAELQMPDTDGPFGFQTGLDRNQAYTVRVVATPAAQQCTPIEFSGTATADVTDLDLACTQESVSIYDIKEQRVSGDVVLRSARVTACAFNGYYLQEAPDDPDYKGVENSGVFVFDPEGCPSGVQAGDEVELVPATIQNFFGQTQLADAHAITLSSGNPVPAPIILTPSMAAGDLPNVYEGVLAEVENLTVTDNAVGFDEFVVNNVLYIDKIFYVVSPFPSNGTTYSSITGILHYRFNRQKLNPRGPGDVIP